MLPWRQLTFTIRFRVTFADAVLAGMNVGAELERSALHLNSFSSRLNCIVATFERRFAATLCGGVSLMLIHFHRKENSMRKAAMVLATAATLGLTAVAAPAPAQARGFHHGFGPAIAGGLLAGALIGGLASSAYAYGPGYGYYGYGPAYYAPAYYGGYYGGGYPYPYYGYGYRRVVRPAYAYYGGPYGWHRGWHHGWRHRW
jgi:hypothetical protein